MKTAMLTLTPTATMITTKTTTTAHLTGQVSEATAADNVSNDVPAVPAAAVKVRYDHHDYDFASQVLAVALLSAVVSVGTTRYVPALE